MYEKITYRTSDAPPEAVEAFEKWKELSLRLDKEAEALFF